jgi:hypothetical protein
MAYAHGKDAVLKVFSTSLRDLSPYLTSVSSSFSADTAEVSTLGDAAKEYISGLKDGTISFEGRFDPTPDSWLNAILGGTAVPFEFHPHGTATSNPKYTGSAILTGYDPSADLGDAVGFSGELQISGAVTRGVN